MNDARLPTEFPFGRTVVTVAVGDILAQGAEMIVLPANRRGVLGALSTPGLSGLRSLGGSDIEREAMALAPLDLGTAVLTGAAGLSERGVAAVIHAAVHPSLGERARPEYVRRAVPAVRPEPKFTDEVPLMQPVPVAALGAPVPGGARGVGIAGFALSGLGAWIVGTARRGPRMTGDAP